MTDPGDSTIHRHLLASYERVAGVRVEAQRLLDAGFPSAALVWAVRSAEMLMRDFVLTPHYLEQGLEWDKAMRKGSKVLGSSNWDRAFVKADEWYGPFDEPLTTDEENAWRAWTGSHVRRRGEIVHGFPVRDPQPEDAAAAIAFAERMATWYAQRFLTSSRHPIGQKFRDAINQAQRALGLDDDDGTGHASLDSTPGEGDVSRTVARKR